MMKILDGLLALFYCSCSRPYPGHRPQFKWTTTRGQVRPCSKLELFFEPLRQGEQTGAAHASSRWWLQLQHNSTIPRAVFQPWVCNVGADPGESVHECNAWLGPWQGLQCSRTRRLHRQNQLHQSHGFYSINNETRQAGDHDFSHKSNNHLGIPWLIRSDGFAATATHRKDHS